MGHFFNEVISKMPIIPTGRTTRKNSLEELRIKFNGEQADPIKEKRVANLVKAREAKKKKNA